MRGAGYTAVSAFHVAMQIRAQVQNEAGRHRVTVSTNGTARSLDVPPKEDGRGSAVNGGELLFLALATCYCNDVYREAARQGIDVRGVEVEVEGAFGGVGEGARDVTYRARVTAAGTTEDEVRRLLAHTDTVAEVHNTLRAGTPVRLGEVAVEIVG